MKKFLSCLGAVMVMVLCCAGNLQDTGIANAEGKKLHIVATTFPQYDWTRQILGSHLEGVELTLLLDNGIDLHSFQPTVEDMATIAGCDMFLYLGGASDAWVPGALRAADNPNRLVVNLLEALGDGVKAEEIVEGMEHEHKEEHEHEEEHDHEDHDDGEEHHHGEGEPDEHVWLSLKNAQVLCAYIASALSKLDAEKAGDYAANASQYQAQLKALDGAYTQAMEEAALPVLLFGDRFPFRYLADDYQLTYYAAFSGCSAETEASFETIAFLTNKLNELMLHSVLVTESADQSIARTVIENSGEKTQSILVMDSMQSVTAKDVLAGVTYLSVMEKNLEVLKSATE